MTGLLNKRQYKLKKNKDVLNKILVMRDHIRNNTFERLLYNKFDKKKPLIFNNRTYNVDIESIIMMVYNETNNQLDSYTTIIMKEENLIDVCKSSSPIEEMNEHTEYYIKSGLYRVEDDFVLGKLIEYEDKLLYKGLELT